jgi:hypothetical protein
MWAYGHHFHTEDVDDGHLTQYCGVELEFNQSIHGSHRDQNTIQGNLGYVKNIQEIIQVELSIDNFRGEISPINEIKGV